MFVEARSRSGKLAWAVAFALSAPIALLPVQAVADEWRAPALLPQRVGLRGIRAVADDPLVGRAAFNSTVIAAMALAIALPAAWFAARALAGGGLKHSVRSRFLVALLLPLLLPPLAVGEGLRTTFLSFGLGFSLFGIALAHVVYVTPYVLIVLLPGFTSDLAAREETARGLGASAPWRWRLVTLPALLPNVLVASALGFIVSWSQYGTTLGVGGGIPTLPLVLLPFVRNDPQIAAVLSLLFVAPAILAIGLSVRHQR